MSSVPLPSRTEHLLKARASRACRVLVAEDEPGLLRLYQLILAPATELWLTRSLTDARGVLSQHQLDVVVTDGDLGDGRGLDLLVGVMAHQPWCRRVLISGQEPPDVIQRTGSTLFHAFVLKPCSVSALRTVVFGPAVAGAARTHLTTPD